MVRSEAIARRRGLLSRLVSLFRLDVNAESLLGRRARLELESVALVLLLIFTFDFASWSLLVNTFLHADILTIDAWSVAAVLVGLIFATMVVLYERQFYTADVWRGWSRVRGPMAARIAVVLASAICTAQPVELLFFKEAIAQRAHEEGIRLELVTRQREAERIEAELAEIERGLASVNKEVDHQVEAQEYNASKESRDAALVQQAQLEAEEARAVGNIDYWQRVIKERQAHVNELESRRASATSALDTTNAPKAAEELETARQRVRDGEVSLRTWRGRLATARSGLNEVGRTLSRLGPEVERNWQRLIARRAELEEKYNQRHQEAESERERIERWIRQLRKVKVGDPEPILEERTAPTRAAAIDAADDELPLEPLLPSGERSAASLKTGADLLRAPLDTDIWRYRFPRYNFFRQLRVLKDLRQGDPPLWEGVSTARAEILARNHGLEHVRRCEGGVDPQGKPCDPEAWRHHLGQTRVYLWSWWIVYAVALIIPTLVLAMKWLMPPELKAYYSAECQAVAGNVDAISVREISRAARRNGEVAS